MPVENANPSDVDDIVQLLVAFYDESPHGERYPVNVARATINAKELIRSSVDLPDAWLALIARDSTGKAVGFTAACRLPDLWSDALIVKDLVIYALPEARGSVVIGRMVRWLRAWTETHRGMVRIELSSGIDNNLAASAGRHFGWEARGVFIGKEVH